MKTSQEKMFDVAETSMLRWITIRGTTKVVEIFKKVR